MVLVQPAGVERCCAFPHPGGEQGPLATMSTKDAAWDQRLEELRQVAVANGGVAHVSTLDPERSALGVWCMNQARAHPPPHDS